MSEGGRGGDWHPHAVSLTVINKVSLHHHLYSFTAYANADRKTCCGYDFPLYLPHTVFAHNDREVSLANSDYRDKHNDDHNSED